ncbi:MAG: GNAT family N-acetyltransferase [Alphaproteobacteria bacterium]|nr:GNAT family N-acetyltransferase [Alphaproteobacteria bacterium]MCB9690991.1 GNAT family N-acetyltransferase [Alphaproteobacteria bacterium]
MAVRIERGELPLSPAVREAVEALNVACFWDRGSEKVDFLEQRPGSTVWLAWDDDELVGLKWGATARPREHHSHHGMVAPSHRRQGIASALMREQHAWAEAAGHRAVTTNTFHAFRPMLLLDLQHGFAVVGVIAHDGDCKLLLERPLGDVPWPPPAAIEGPGWVANGEALIAALRDGASIEGVVVADGGVSVRLTPRSA